MRLVLLALCLSPWVLAQDADHPLSVCEALQNRAQYNKKTIYLRGRLSTTEEGAWLVGSECAPPIVTDKERWLPLLWMEGSDNSTENHELFLKLVAAKDPNRTKRITVTVQANFETFLDLSRRVVINRLGQRMYVGYGHLGQALAQIYIGLVVLTDIVFDDQPPQR